MQKIEIRNSEFEDHILDRGHIFYEGKKIKFLHVSLFEQCYYGNFPKDFIYRLPDSDERTTEHFSGSQCFNDWYNNLPIGIWCQIVTPALN